MAIGSSRQWKPSRGVSHNFSKRNAFDSSVRGTASGTADSNDLADARDRNSLREPIDSTYFAGSGSLKSKRSPPPGFSGDARFTRLLRSSHEDSSSMIQSKGSFVPYLPQDDAVAAGLGADEGGIDAVETQEVADLLNEELGKLLMMKPRDFWRTVAMDNTIEASLDSYLQFRRRWYDLPINAGGRWLAGIIVGDHELFRRVFMVLYRMSLSLERGSSASDDLCPEQHAEIIQEKRLFDIPKILDICAIYGRDNPDLTRLLVNNIFVDQKKYNSDLAEVVPILLKTIYTMHQRCCSTLMMLPSTSTSQISVALKLEQELLEVLDFLNDAVVTLHSFIAAYPQGSVILVTIGSQSILREQLLPSLAAVHDALLPTVRKTFSHLGPSGITSSIESAAETRWKRLRVGLMELSWQLLSLSYLSEKSAMDQHNYTFMADPGARGQAFVQVMSSMAADLSEDFGYQLSGSVKGELISVGALLRNIEKKHKLLERVEKLRDESFIDLDDIQYEYVASLVNHASSLSSQLPNFSHLSLTDRNGGQRQDADILYESKISHIKDILPDYGNGFIAACLEAYDFNPEEVIQRILDGTLHPSLLLLDKTLESKPGGLLATVSTNDKGKGKVDEAPSLALHRGGKNGIARKDKNDVTPSASIVSNEEADGLVQRLASSRSASSSSAVEFNRELPSKISVLDSDKSLKGRFVRKEKGEGNAASVLDERDEEDALRTAAYAAQYEDEYDDSFDDLGTNIADGVEETESLVDLFAFRSSGAGFPGQTSKIFAKAKSGGLPKSTWAEDDSGSLRVNQPMALNPGMERTSFARENGTRSSDTDRRPPFHPTRGRGRGRREEPKAQYFVKDGKNYSYKVPGSVAVSSKEEAEFLNKTEEETIYGLGRGGNVPVVVQEATDGNASTGPHVHRGSRAVHTDLSGHGREHSHGRGGPRKGHDDHHRKDRAMKKHFASVGGM